MENGEIDGSCLAVPWYMTIPQANKRMTMVRTAVARFESTFRMPIFARIDVAAAKTADRTAYTSQFMVF